MTVKPCDLLPDRFRNGFIKQVYVRKMIDRLGV